MAGERENEAALRHCHAGPTAVCVRWTVGELEGAKDPGMDTDLHDLDHAAVARPDAADPHSPRLCSVAGYKPRPGLIDPPVPFRRHGDLAGEHAGQQARER